MRSPGFYVENWFMVLGKNYFLDSLDPLGKGLRTEMKGIQPTPIGQFVIRVLWAFWKRQQSVDALLVPTSSGCCCANLVTTRQSWILRDVECHQLGAIIQGTSYRLLLWTLAFLQGM